jgi:hypothetical protein
MKARNCLQCGAHLQAERWGSRFCGTCRVARYAKNGRAEAITLVQKAIKLGTLPSPRGFACEDCGGPATQYDHRDYSKPLDVVPVCCGCNNRRPPAKWARYVPLQRDRTFAAPSQEAAA